MPGALLDDDVMEELRLADIAERQRLERRIARHDVTAILVSHDGARWLPYSLTALADLTHPPHRVVAVDTGSTDASRRFLVESLTEAGVIDQPEHTPYGEAIRAAVQAYLGAPGLPTPDVEAPRVEWLWLLHDDSAPEADALRHLLLAAERNPSAAVIGPKIRGWRDGRLLLELGVSVGRGGRRETWLERDETDQGQHDHRREVLAVGSAGMLVRRDVWDELGGFDPALADVPRGRRLLLAGLAIRSRGRRRSGRGRPPRGGGRALPPPARRRPHARTCTAPTARPRCSCSWRTSRRWALPWAYVRLLIGSLLRAPWAGPGQGARGVLRRGHGDAGGARSPGPGDLAPAPGAAG